MWVDVYSVKFVHPIRHLWGLDSYLYDLHYHLKSLHQILLSILISSYLSRNFLSLDPFVSPNCCWISCGVFIYHIQVLNNFSFIFWVKNILRLLSLSKRYLGSIFDVGVFSIGYFTSEFGKILLSIIFKDSDLYFDYLCCFFIIVFNWIGFVLREDD